MSFVQEKAFSFPNRCEKPVFISFDRVMFGSSSLYVLHHPTELQKKRKEGVHVEEITYDIAQEEITANSGFGVAKGVGQTKSELPRSNVVALIGPLYNFWRAYSLFVAQEASFPYECSANDATRPNHTNSSIKVVVVVVFVA